ncbi:recombinase family protein [Nonomuraea typhae]|uniref:Recombinase family protein n=1 Tax=Nonomuraea typhae TaxID=2603600 RepID=A0ABW7YYA4_9ACTN
MDATSPHQMQGRWLAEHAPERLTWILLARESANRPEQIAHQFSDLHELVGKTGGRILEEVTELAVSSFKKKRVRLPDGTDGYRVIRPDWETVLTKLRRGEANALAADDLDRVTREPRLLEDLIEVVEHYGAHVISKTGNINLTTDEGIDAARGVVKQRNQESRNTSRRVTDGQRHAALAGKNHGGPYRAFGWRKDQIKLNKRESAHVRREVPRIISGVKPITLAKEWNKRGIPTVTGAQWRAATIRNMYLRPRMCGWVVYRGAILRDVNGDPVKGQWEPILTEAEYHQIKAAWTTEPDALPSRVTATGRGHRTKYLLSPFVRCGKCKARMIGNKRYHKGKEPTPQYACPAKGQGGCGGVTVLAAPVDAYIKALVVAEHQKIQFTKVKEIPPWPKAKELTDLQGRIDETSRRYEQGGITDERYWPSLERMEKAEAVLLQEQRKYQRNSQRIKGAIIDLAKKWEDPDFAMEQKQAAVAETLSAVIIMPVGMGKRFHPDRLKPVFK